MERFPAAGGDPGAGRYEPLAKRFSACPVAGAAAGATTPPDRPQSPCPSWRPDDPDRDGHLERSARPARAESHQLPGSTRRRRGADQRARDASAELAGQVREWTRQRTPPAVTAATAKTPLQITCPRRGSGPAAFTAKTPKTGLEITAGRRAVIKGSPRRWLLNSPRLSPSALSSGLYVMHRHSWRGFGTMLGTVVCWLTGWQGLTLESIG